MSSGTKPTLVFFGNERIATGVTTGAPVLHMLIEQGYHVAAVVTNYEPAQSRRNREPEIAGVAHAYHIPVLMPRRLGDIADELAGYNAQAGVLVAYGKIVPERIINLFPRGIINLHPSLLPLHRGPTPIESAMLSGESTTGVSLMALAKQMDAGPVYAQSELPLDGTESKQSLADQLLDIGTAMLRELLPDILNGSVVAMPQDDSLATYDQLLAKTAGTLDWHKPAAQLAREVRAYLEWPKSRTTLASKEVVVTKARAESHLAEGTELAIGQAIATAAKEIAVKTAEGYLVLEQLKPAGKADMPAHAFLAGHPAL